MEKIKVIAKHTLMYENALVKEGDVLEYHPTDAANLVAAGAVDYADKKDYQEPKEKKEILHKDEPKEKKELGGNPGATITIKGKK